MSVMPDVQQEHDATHKASSPFDRRSARYWISESPSWYLQHITPGNPLYHLTPHRITSLYGTFGGPGQLSSYRESETIWTNLRQLGGGDNCAEESRAESMTKHIRAEVGLIDNPWKGSWLAPEKADRPLAVENDLDLFRKVFNP